MSIGKRVTEAIEKYQARDFEGALIPACIAIDATAKKEFPKVKTVGARYKSFLRNYMWMIGLVGLRGIVARNIRLKYIPPNLKPGPDGCVPIEDILYEIIRCGLLHEAGVADYIVLSDDVILGYDGDRYVISAALPLGLTVAAMISPTNSIEKLANPKFTITIGRKKFVASQLWGQHDSLIQQLRDGEI